MYLCCCFKLVRITARKRGWEIQTFGEDGGSEIDIRGYLRGGLLEGSCELFALDVGVYVRLGGGAWDDIHLLTGLVSKD